MPKIKEVLPNILNVGKESNQKAYTSKEGRLETDALPFGIEGQLNNGNESVSNTPTASTELTESVVRELSDPNYNSMAMVESVTVPGTMANGTNQQQALAVGGLAGAATTMNTMNVHSAQQHVVMNFSNASNLHFGSVYNINQNVGANSSRNSICNADDSCAAAAQPTADYCGSGGGGGSKPQARQILLKTRTIVKMMQSDKEPHHRLLDAVATHLGENWKQVMRDLGHSEGQIVQARIDNEVHGHSEVIYQLLLGWLHDAEDGAGTVGRLTTVLWKRGHHECVQRMKLVWKELENQKVHKLDGP